MRTPRSVLASLLALAPLLAPSAAHAMSADFDGEHGIELSLGVGYGGFTNNSLRLFEPADTASPDDRTILSGGANLRLNLGYRPINLFSVGVSLQYQFVGSDSLAGVTTSASAGSVGVYARFYPMALIDPAWAAQPRVAFNGLLDRRRLDPWVSLGFEFYQALGLRAQNAGSDSYATWVRHSVGIPITVGAEVRILPALAAGISFGFTPWIGGGFDTETRYVLGGNQVTEQNVCHRNDPADHSTCSSPVGANVSWFLGLSVRYTFSL